MKDPRQLDTPIQPVENPVICNPYDEPNDHYFYDKETGEATRAGGTRRPAGYWYKTDRVGTGQRQLFLEEDHDLLDLVKERNSNISSQRCGNCPRSATRLGCVPIL